MSTYVFDPAWTMERDRLRALESLFDGASTRHLAGIGVAEGWRCLEVGCGAGGIARWLARRVRGSGRVVATDLDTRFVEGHDLDNMEVRQHDLMTDALEAGAFDLAHARAVVMHIPDHQGALERVVAAVRPGGWVVIEDLDFGGPMATALARYSFPAKHAALVERVYRAAETVLAAAGADATFGTRLLAGLRTAGLERVHGEVHAPLVAGGTENWVRGSIQQLATRLEGTGLVSADEVARFLALAADGSSRYAPPFMVTPRRQRPPA
jgi:2-polyprenyl-3-methyl-5-hydroxy-6-metoxy-1,4-benzoquinol methylase